MEDGGDLAKNHEGRDLGVGVKDLVERLVKLVWFPIWVQGVKTVVEPGQANDVQGCLA